MKSWGVIVEMDTPIYKILLMNKIWKYISKIGITLNNEWGTLIQNMEFFHQFDKPGSPSVPFLSWVYHSDFCLAISIQEHNVVIFLCFGKVLVEEIPKHQNLMLTCGSDCVWAPVTCDIQ